MIILKMSFSFFMTRETIVLKTDQFNQVYRKNVTISRGEAVYT